MKPWNVRVTAKAEDDLTKAALYIRDELGNPQAALRLVDKFDACVRDLSAQPSFRPLARDTHLARLGYRWTLAGSYMVFYTLDETTRTVYVERVLYGRSDWRATL